jgi:amino acid transporter
MSESPKQGTLKKEFNLLAAFSFAFAYISPIVAVYGVFGIAMSIVGPGYWIAIPIALLGQYLVANVLAEVSSKYPYEGSLYQWAGKLVGPRYGWMTGWIYVWTVLIAMATVAVGATNFWASAFGIDVSKKSSLIVGSLIIILFCTIANIMGRKAIKIMIFLSISAEIIGSIGLATVLMVSHQVNPFSVILNNGLDASSGITLGSLTLGIALAGWSFLGFESSGSVAEEVINPEINVPKALKYSLLAIGAITMFSSLFLILAIPDIKSVISGNDADPIASTISGYFGENISTIASIVFAIGFTACVLGLQTGTSRVIYAFARDGVLPFSKQLSTLTPKNGIPANAIILVAILPAAIFLLTGSNIYNTLVTYTIGGWYLTFVLVLLGYLKVRASGKWEPGKISMGSRSLPIAIIATLWAVFETINISWPRSVLTGDVWYLQWALVLVLGAIILIGFLIQFNFRDKIKSNN